MTRGRNLNRARDLRRNQTPAEAKLWEQLSNRKCAGFKFLRQAPIGPYIVDFLCREKKLVVELDGWTHSTQEEIARDEARTSYLHEQGYRVIRFNNDDALQGIDGLLSILAETLQQ